MRTFVGIPLRDDVATGALEACARVSELDNGWRREKWVPAANLHVTIKFIGSVPEDEVEALTDAIAVAIGEGRPAFSLPVDAIRAVPTHRRARMLWAAFLDPSGACASLAADVERAVLPFGAAPDERTFAPHATLVRARTAHALSEVALEAANETFARAVGALSVAHVTLYRSVLTPTGPVYSELRSYRLG